MNVWFIIPHLLIHNDKEKRVMCMNKKIRPVWERENKKPEVLILDEFNQARAAFLACMRTKTQERSGLTTQTRWNLIKDRIEREYETNEG